MELNHDGVAEEETTDASTLHYLILRDNTSLFTLPLVCLKGGHYIPQLSLASFFLGTLKIHFWVINLILQASRLASACFQTVRLNLTYRMPRYTALLYFLFISNHWIFLKQLFMNFLISLFFWLCWVFIAARASSRCSEWGLLFLEVHGLLITGASLAAEQSL